MNRSGRSWLPTNEICKRAFARHLQLLLLDEVYEHPKYNDIYSKLAEKLEVHPNYPDNGLFDERLFKLWWNGDGFPRKQNKEIIDLVFSGLTDHWFTRSHFMHRIPMYLASIDLPYLKSNKQTTVESTNILAEIAKSWAPFNPESDTYDLCIYGSQQRGGYKKDSGDSRKDETYDLSMIYSSYVGIEVPNYIAKIFQENYIDSIIPYMFCLLCLNINDNKSGYKADLLFDFLTALNCISTQIPNLSMSYISSDDLVQKQILTISSLINDLFQVKSYLPSKLKTDIKEYNELKDVSDPPCLALINHPICELPNVFINILKSYLSESELSELYQKTKVEGGSNSLNEATEEFASDINIFGFNTAQEVKKNAICLNSLKNENGLECWEISQHALNIFSEAINFYFFYFKMAAGLEPIELLESFNTKVTTNEDISNLERVVTRFSTERYPLKP